jgi:glycerol-3-phosphate acyltransferase PlsY
MTDHPSFAFRRHCRFATSQAVIETGLRGHNRAILPEVNTTGKPFQRIPMIDPLGGPAYLLPLALAFVIAYLIGSIPFGLIITSVAGAGDVRRIGSGNIGATNVLRTGRKGLALATLLADALKGFLPAFLALTWYGNDVAVVAGLATVLGHCFPVWLRFKGGKGVATGAGVLLALVPLAFAAALVFFIGIVWLTRYVSLGSVLAAPVAAVVAFLLGHVQYAELFALISLIIAFAHRENIVRLVKGTENKLGASKKSAPDA